jgi:1-acyl-sn-glycerol-3-phosphate acyltransferase
LPKEPFVIISNHTSFLDVFLMCGLLPKHPFVFMAKSELLKVPLFGTLFKHYHIPVYRNNRKKAAEAVLKGKQALKDDLCIVIFPEGGIIDGYAPRLAPFKNGAFELALAEKVGILPITFLSNFKIIGDAEKPFSVSRPGIAQAVVHQFITKEEVQDLSVKELKNKCFEIIEKPLREKYLF